MRVILVGFPGCGKSSVGKRLAAKLGCGFVDLDAAFEEAYHVSIPIFFARYNETAFRSCERKVLLDNMQLMKEKGVVVYIKMSPISLFDRLTHAKRPRPLVQKRTPEELRQYIETTLSQREAFYNQAHITVKGESIDIDGLCDKLMQNSFPYCEE